MKLKNDTIQPLQKKQLLVLSFVEGACVMIAELAGGKMLAPFYGTSLYVWASTLAITLGGLAIGYFLGALQSEKDTASREKALFITLAIASSLVIIMPKWANFLMHQTLSLDFLPGLVLAQLLFLLPPILAMGIVSPLLISLIAGSDNSGKAAGSVYAISTLGGVFATLLTGFWLVPLLGVAIPCVTVGIILFLLNLVLLKPNKKMVSASLVLLAIMGSSFASKSEKNENSVIHVSYHNEGMLGQIKIIEFPFVANQHNFTCRSMLVNHNWQTWVDANNPDFSFLYYTRISKAFINSLPKGSKALLIGLGGGTVARQLEKANVNYDAVEIDERLPELANEYFGLKDNGQFIVDDGRHYINTCKKQYDLIIIDALLGENVPSHLLSKESFTQLKNLLNKEGHIFIEFDEIEKESDGYAQKMLLNTMQQAGYNVNVFGSVPNSREGDVIYVAGLSKENDFSRVMVDSDSYYPYHGNLEQFRFSLGKPVAEVITDDNPSLDYYLRSHMVKFRQEFLLKYNKQFMKEDMAFFN